MTKLEVKILDLIVCSWTETSSLVQGLWKHFNFAFVVFCSPWKTEVKTGDFPYDIRSVFTKRLITVPSPFRQRSKFSN